MSETNKRNGRRLAVRLIGAALAVLPLWGLYRFLTPEIDVNDIMAELPDTDIPEGGAVVFPDKKIAVMRMEGKITAVSLTCTHLGCTVALDGGKFLCPCHGSFFSLDGSVLKGPAERRLDAYKTEEKNGQVFVYNQVNELW